MRNLLCFLFVLNTCYIYSQSILLGGRTGPKIQTSSSHNYQASSWQDSAAAFKTINADGMIYELLDASRFLYQATLGSSLDQMEQLSYMPYDQWIDNQIAQPPSLMVTKIEEIKRDVLDWYFLYHTDSTNAPFYTNWIHFNYGWWDMNLKNKDKLRQRVALALSEVVVISADSDLANYGNALASYYDILIRNAFGNYKDMLLEVALHPAMGYYLSHLNNPKAIPAENIYPDENFAREIMQLFSIGLVQLNQDGTEKKDSLGNSIPTYSMKEIKEMARVFTGLGFSAVMPNMWVDSARFGLDIYIGDPTKSMRMYERFHELGTKTLLNGYVIPAGQKGMKDIEDAVQHLFDHPNTAPFVCKQLIQRLITSNPSPAYISRISAVFNDDGKGMRGNMAAVVKAILLDKDARSCETMTDPKQGQLREPMIRYTQFANAMKIDQFYDRYWNSGYDFYQSTGQFPLNAPSVFNFYSPSYTPRGEIANNKLVAPEFQILNSRTSISYINYVNYWAVYHVLSGSWEEDDPYTYVDIDDLKKLARDPEVLLNRLDILFTHGNLSDRTRGIIKYAIDGLKSGDYRADRTELALYLLLISPDYVIFK